MRSYSIEKIMRDLVDPQRKQEIRFITIQKIDIGMHLRIKINLDLCSSLKSP
jgi:hypothetical protein